MLLLHFQIGQSGFQGLWQGLSVNTDEAQADLCVSVQ